MTGDKAMMSILITPIQRSTPNPCNKTKKKKKEEAYNNEKK